MQRSPPQCLNSNQGLAEESPASRTVTPPQTRMHTDALNWQSRVERCACVASVMSSVGDSTWQIYNIYIFGSHFYLERLRIKMEETASLGQGPNSDHFTYSGIGTNNLIVTDTASLPAKSHSTSHGPVWDVHHPCYSSFIFNAGKVHLNSFKICIKYHGTNSVSRFYVVLISIITHALFFSVVMYSTYFLPDVS